MHTSPPRYAHIVNFLVAGLLPNGWTKLAKEVFISRLKYYFLDDLELFFLGPNWILRQYVHVEEHHRILDFCHTSACGGHFSGHSIAAKVLQSSFYWRTLFKDGQNFCKCCVKCQTSINMSKHNAMPLQSILIIEHFNVWGIDFMGPFPSLFSCWLCF